MFYCERCGSRFNETVAEAALRFRLFSRSALQVAGIEARPAPEGRRAADPTR
jgi:hypothetical protein